MAAATLNLSIEQGTDFEATFTVRNKSGSGLNLLSYTANSTLKKHYTSTTSHPFTFSFAFAFSSVVAPLFPSIVLLCSVAA